jgi:hypothetical protein
MTVPNPNPAASVNLTVGGVATTVIEQLDTLGNQMIAPISFDAPPVWTQATPATDTLTVAGDAQSATETGLAAGGDVITCTVMVGGVSYVATQPIAVTAAPQQFGGIALVTTTSASAKAALKH